MYKYKVGDRVVISKRLSKEGGWVDTNSVFAIVVEIKPTITFGAAYVLEVRGERLGVCYWTTDIDGLVNDEEILWKTWGDQ